MELAKLMEELKALEAEEDQMMLKNPFVNPDQVKQYFDARIKEQQDAVKESNQELTKASDKLKAEMAHQMPIQIQTRLDKEGRD